MQVAPALSWTPGEPRFRSAARSEGGRSPPVGKRGDLVSRRIADLDALGMAWDPYEEAWQQGLAAAREYRAEHGARHSTRVCDP